MSHVKLYPAARADIANFFLKIPNTVVASSTWYSRQLLLLSKIKQQDKNIPPAGLVTVTSSLSALEAGAGNATRRHNSHSQLPGPLVLTVFLSLF